MEVGFATLNGSGWDVGPAELARTLEDMGYDSLWVGEHSHIPVERRTPYPMGGDLPEAYSHMMDPYVSLMAAGAVTERLRLATGVALPLESNIFGLAKSVATLDVLSGGRVLFGVGAGWNVEQFENQTAVPFRQRYRALGECVGALRSLWTEPEPEYHGEFYDFDPVRCFPKPEQEPHPPVLAGFVGSIGVRQVAQWADGWCPIDIAFPERNIRRGLERVARACDGIGRDPASIEVTLLVGGDPDEAMLHEYREMGIARIVLGPGRAGWAGRFTTMKFLDHYAPVVTELTGR